LENLGYDISFNLRRLWRLIRREGIRAAFRKGWPYLNRRIVDEFRLRNLARTGTTEERFTKIYKWNFWRAAESVSGPGSSLNDTETLRKQLPVIFRQFDIKSVVDAPCGDFRWMQLVVKDNDITYTGGDIVKPMIEKNQATFGSDLFASFTWILPPALCPRPTFGSAGTVFIICRSTTSLQRSSALSNQELPIFLPLMPEPLWSRITTTSFQATIGLSCFTTNLSASHATSCSRWTTSA
jgi:hypothetical protein